MMTPNARSSEDQLCADHPEHPRYRKLVTKARHTNASRDRDEVAFGFAPPSHTIFLHLRTGLEAVSAGLCLGDWDCVAEGFVMLQESERTLRPLLLAMQRQQDRRETS
jgi:hypothetical protein